MLINLKPNFTAAVSTTFELKSMLYFYTVLLFHLNYNLCYLKMLEVSNNTLFKKYENILCRRVIAGAVR